MSRVSDRPDPFLRKVPYRPARRARIAQAQAPRDDDTALPIPYGPLLSIWDEPTPERQPILCALLCDEHTGCYFCR